MNYFLTLKPICGLLATALLAFAQTPAPRAVPAPPPPDAWEQTPAPVPRPMPMPMPTPVAPLPPLPPLPPVDIDLGDLDVQISMAKEMMLSPELLDQIEAAKEQVGRMKLDIQERAKDMARAVQ